MGPRSHALRCSACATRLEGTSWIAECPKCRWTWLKGKLPEPRSAPTPASSDEDPPEDGLQEFLSGMAHLPFREGVGPAPRNPWLNRSLLAFLVVGATLRGRLAAIAAFMPGHASLSAFFLHSFVPEDQASALLNVYLVFILGPYVEAVLRPLTYGLLILAAGILGAFARFRYAFSPALGCDAWAAAIAAYFFLCYPRARIGVLVKLPAFDKLWLRMPGVVAIAMGLVARAFWALVQWQSADIPVEAALGGIIELLGGLAVGAAFWVFGTNRSQLLAAQHPTEESRPAKAG